MGKISGGIGPLNLLKDNVEKLCLEGWKEASQVCTRVDKFCGRTLSHFMDCIRKNGRSISSHSVGAGRYCRYSHSVYKRARGVGLFAKSPIGIS